MDARPHLEDGDGWLVVEEPTGFIVKEMTTFGPFRSMVDLEEFLKQRRNHFLDA